MTVSAVIPNWNRRDDLARVLADLRKQTVPLKEVIVVDNGSSDGSAQSAEAAGARVIRFETNMGFAFAVNRGIEAASGHWVAILNNDVLLAPDWLERLLEAAQDSGAWFAGGKLRQASDPSVLDGGFDLICRGACAWRAGAGRPDGPEWSFRRSISLVPFTAALFRRDLFDRVGLLDERFESYLEDVDFGLRCAMDGYAGVYAPDADVRHIGSATWGRWSPETIRRISRNQLLLVAKHYPRDWRRRYLRHVLAAQLLWGVVAARNGAFFAWLRGKQEGLRMFGACVRSFNPNLDRVLRDSEAEIRRLQGATGYDRYWRLYFAIIGS